MTSTREYRVSAQTVRLPAILWEGVFEVPWHQREFDWDPENVKQFWDDIQRNVENDEDDYFIGSITLTERGGRRYHIQDGQQRLTTYSMMVAALRDKVPDDHKARVYPVIYDIAHGTMPTGTDNLRIRHQERDQNNYGIIMKGGQITPNGKLSEAYEVLTKKVGQLDRTQATKLLDYLMDSVIANRTINCTDNATQVFETLNDRGKEVDQVDLLRNFLYSHLKGDRSDLHRQVHRNLEDMKRLAHDPKQRTNSTRLDAYVLCALKCRYGPIRMKSLYQDAKIEIQKEIAAKGKENAEETIRELTAYLCNRKNIDAFIVLYKGDEHATEIADFTEAAGAAARQRNMRDYVRELSEYKAVSLPITFAVVTRFLNAPQRERKRIASAGHRIVQDFNALIMRTAIVQPRFVTSPFDVVIARWGREIMESVNNDTQKRISNEIVQEDREKVWTDSAFQEKMEALRFLRTKDAKTKAKLLLYALYRQEQSDLPILNRRLTLEHVLPESVEHVAGWSPHFTGDNHERYANMLGNMTLLTSSDNKGNAFNQSFENKRPTFQESAMQANRRIADNEEWTPDAIVKRQRQLAKDACQVWKPSGPAARRGARPRRG